MRRLVELMLKSLLVVGLLSCGGDGDEPDHPPAITNLRYSPAAAHQVTGGRASITVLADFTDAAGDVASARMASTSGDDVTVPLSGLHPASAIDELLPDRWSPAAA